MHVAFLCGRYHPRSDGVSDYLCRLSGTLRRAGHRVTVVTGAPCEPGEEVIAVADAWGIGGAWAAARSLTHLQPDVIHLQHSPGVFDSRWGVEALPALLGPRRPPLVTTLHELGSGRPPPLPSRVGGAVMAWGERRGLWERECGLLATRSDALVATHHAALRMLAARLGPDERRPPRRILVPLAPNLERVPIPRAVARERVLSVTGWPASSRLVAFFGFLHPVKGISSLLEALARVRAAGVDARLVLLGGFRSLVMGEHEAEAYRARLEGEIGRLGLREAAHVTGYVGSEEASSWLLGCDVGALPFTYGLSLKSGSLLAMLAHDLPVLGTAGMEEPVLEEREAVVRVPPRDPEALSGILRGWLSRPDRLERLRREARALGDGFGWEAVGEAHARLYRSLTSGEPAPPVEV